MCWLRSVATAVDFRIFGSCLEFTGTEIRLPYLEKKSSVYFCGPVSGATGGRELHSLAGQGLNKAVHSPMTDSLLYFFGMTSLQLGFYCCQLFCATAFYSTCMENLYENILHISLHANAFYLIAWTS